VRGGELAWVIAVRLRLGGLGVCGVTVRWEREMGRADEGSGKKARRRRRNATAEPGCSGQAGREVSYKNFRRGRRGGETREEQRSREETA